MNGAWGSTGTYLSVHDYQLQLRGRSWPDEVSVLCLFTAPPRLTPFPFQGWGKGVFKNKLKKKKKEKRRFYCEGLTRAHLQLGGICSPHVTSLINKQLN